MKVALAAVHRKTIALLVLAGLVAPVSASAANGTPEVVSVSVSGNAHVPTSRILAAVRTHAGAAFDERTVREDLQRIFDLGYFADQVPPLIRRRPGGLSITFRVIENPIVSKIVFEGDAHVPADTLLALMDTAPGQVLNTNTFHADVLKINAYYDKVGYSGQLASHVTNIKVELKTGILDIAIREGLAVRNVVVKGDTVLPADDFRAVLSAKPGQLYGEAQHEADLNAVKAVYAKHDLDLGDFQVAIDPATVDQAAGTGDVVYTISAARVGVVQITGNAKTKDNVIRRQLRLHPGDVITTSGLKRDYERLNNLGFFSKVDLSTKPGPDPQRPQFLAIDWSVAETRTGTAQLGAGYSGGATGTGLTGTVSYSESDINGTGNGASVRFERGSRVSDESISVTIPYLGDTPQRQKYSLSGTLFNQDQTNFYQVYQGTAQSAIAPTPIISVPGSGATAGSNAGAGTIPVVLTPNSSAVAGIVSTYKTKSTGGSLNVGRRLSDNVTASLGGTIERLSTNVTVPAPYFINGTTPGSIGGVTNSFGGYSGNTLGIAASSIADTINGQSYNLHSVSLAFADDSRDDVFNPRRGVKASLSEEFSSHSLGSSFNYTLTTVDAAQFFPILKNATLGVHGQIGATTGAVPPNKLFVFSDQQLRGYSDVFYGTQALLFQGELRVPVTKDKRFGVAAFTDYGALKIRGAAPILNNFGNTLVNYDRSIYHADVGLGLRVDLPQLGFRSIRLDLAKGKLGTHTSFGIGQSF